MAKDSSESSSQSDNTNSNSVGDKNVSAAGDVAAAAASDPKSTGNEKVDTPAIQESGVSLQDLKTRIGRVYGSNVELVEDSENGVYTAKLQSTSYGTRTFVLDGEGKSAEEARTDLWNRIPMYRGSPSQQDRYPHDYARPNAV